MTLVLFAVIIFVLLIVAFFINNRSIVSPVVLFTGAFVVLNIFALVGSVYWDYEMSDEALFVLMIGIFAFALVTSLIHKAFFSRLAIPQDHKEWILPVKQGVLDFGCAFSIRSFRSNACSDFGNIATIVFMFIANALIMSFFSNKFYENALTLQMTRTLIYFLICYFVYICFLKINGRTALYEVRSRKQAGAISDLDA